MKKAFDPISGLFIPTSEQLLTPNPASVYVRENHLAYFHFLGKMLGVAIFNVSSFVDCKCMKGVVSSDQCLNIFCDHLVFTGYSGGAAVCRGVFEYASGKTK